ncbi:MAG: hypothetical protein U9R00_00800 [Patescibacteria group bacterium]|nr:hypothetical protein [Patescibacteria group bacterium]
MKKLFFATLVIFSLVSCEKEEFEANPMLRDSNIGIVLNEETPSGSYQKAYKFRGAITFTGNPDQVIYAYYSIGEIYTNRIFSIGGQMLMTDSDSLIDIGRYKMNTTTGETITL